MTDINPNSKHGDRTNQNNFVIAQPCIVSFQHIPVSLPTNMWQSYIPLTEGTSPEPDRAGELSTTVDQAVLTDVTQRTRDPEESQSVQ